MVRYLGLFVCLSVFAGAFSMGGAAADTLRFDLGLSYSGDADPAGSPPWLRAEFEDLEAGKVRLTLTSLLLAGEDEFISDWFFNFDGDRHALGDLAVSQTGDPGDPDASVHTGYNRYNRAGAGRFDIRFSFDTGNGRWSNRFEAGESAVFLITGHELTVAHFNVTSSAGLFTLAHVQGLDDCDQSVWITVGNTTGGTPPPTGGPNPPGTSPVPEPATLLLLGLGLVAHVVRGRFRA